MDKILNAILDRDFKNCFYRTGMFTNMVSELIGSTYLVEESYNDGNKAVVDIGDVCKVNIELSDTSYIRSIIVEAV